MITIRPPHEEHAIKMQLSIQIRIAAHKTMFTDKCLNRIHTGRQANVGSKDGHQNPAERIAMRITVPFTAPHPGSHYSRCHQPVRVTFHQIDN